MGTMTIAILTVSTKGIIHSLCPCPKLRMIGLDASINHIGSYSGTGIGIGIAATQRQGTLIDTINTPRITIGIHGLGGIERYLLVSLNRLDAGVVLQCIQLTGIQCRSK